MANDGVQHGIDDNPHGDAGKGAVGGAVGGAIVGALAGGPVGAVIGAVAGGVASGVGVAAVDQVDNDNTVSGLGSGTTSSDQVGSTGMAGDSMVGGSTAGGHNIVTGGPAVTDDGKTGLGAGAIAGGVVGAAVGGPVGAVVGGALGSVAGGVAGDATEAADVGTAGTGYTETSSIGTVAHTSQPIDTNVNANLPGNNVPGVQTGGYTTSGQDTRGIMEKTADTLTGDRTDDKTGGQVVDTSGSMAGGSLSGAAHNVVNADLPGNNVPGVQTGGVTTSGQDTRGMTEKAADALTGDRTDDKTGGRVL